MKQSFIRAIGYWLACLMLGFMTTGCTTIKLVGDYDEQIDKGVTALQKDVETFLIKLEMSAPKPQDTVEAYSQNTAFYAATKVTISGLRIRADATERNSLTVRQLDKVLANIELLEDMHKNTITAAEINVLIRGGFNSQFTAILTFELAKKRGQKPEESKAVAAITPITKGDK